MKKYRCFFLGGMDVLVIFVIHFAITNTIFSGYDRHVNLSRISMFLWTSSKNI